MRTPNASHTVGLFIGGALVLAVVLALKALALMLAVGIIASVLDTPTIGFGTSAALIVLVGIVFAGVSTTRKMRKQ